MSFVDLIRCVIFFSQLRVVDSIARKICREVEMKICREVEIPLTAWEIQELKFSCQFCRKQKSCSLSIYVSAFPLEFELLGKLPSPLEFELLV